LAVNCGHFEAKLNHTRCIAVFAIFVNSWKNTLFNLHRPLTVSNFNGMFLFSNQAIEASI
jgi:hypothetical protein